MDVVGFRMLIRFRFGSFPVVLGTATSVEQIHSLQYIFDACGIYNICIHIDIHIIIAIDDALIREL